MILLDTDAVIWVLQNHPRVSGLTERPRLYLSPASLLEIQMLLEAGRLRVAGSQSVAAIARDPRWRRDEPPAGDWFDAALRVGWTRDPFDRLIVAHAMLRGWVLATSDRALLERLPPEQALRL